MVPVFCRRSDPMVQKTWDRRSEYQVIESMKYFLDRMSRIMQPEYVATPQDILHIRIRSSGEYFLRWWRINKRARGRMPRVSRVFLHFSVTLIVLHRQGDRGCKLLVAATSCCPQEAKLSVWATDTRWGS